MKKQLIVLTITLFLAALPLAVLAAGHGGGMGSMEGSNGMQGQDMKGMQGEEGMHGMGDMIMLGSKTTDGVVAVGHLMPASGDEKDNMGMKMTHRFMIMCNNEQTGAYIEEGLAALKVTDPSGHTSDAMKLMPMPMGMVKGFATGVNLSEKGTYKFEVGSKLADGQKRTFEFSYTVK